MSSVAHRLIYRNITHANAEGRFGKQDFRYAAEDVYICPTGERLT
jgi:hypothetical protein